MPHYASKVRVGLTRVSSFGDGYTINLQWIQAYPDNPNNQIAYHIYYATFRENVFLEGVRLVVIDGSLEINVIALTPGKEYFFCVRPVEYDPTVFNLSLLPISHDNVRFYPSSMLRQNMSATDLIVPLMDVEGFPNIGVVKVGIELIQYLAVDTVNNNLIIQAGTPPTNGHLVLQSNNEYYIASPSNVGQGTINNLMLISATSNETWSIRCIFVQRDINNNPIPGTAKFEAIGSITGPPVDGYGNFFVWLVNGTVVSNGYLSFSITETVPFVPGDSFTAQVAGIVPGLSGGRGFNNTPITMHTIDGYDGYNIWSSSIPLFTLTESVIYDNIYVCLCRFEYPNFAATVLDGYKQVITDYLSTDDDAADAANVTFPMYDYSGYHRTDPVQLLNGTCVGSYIGGQMGCIDAYGNYNIFRGMSLQDQNTQREDILLSVTGQPAVLIKRQENGAVCSCYLSTSEYQDDRCPFCFVPDTLVNTERGFVPIKDIQIGNKVLGSDGDYHAVLNVMIRNYTGKLQSITTTTTTNPILCTPEHPFLSLGGLHGETNDCGPNSNCKAFIDRGDNKRSRNGIKQLPSGRWQARAQAKNHLRKVLGTFNTREEAQQAIDTYFGEHQIPGHQFIWRDASELTKKNWLVNKWYRHIEDVEVVDIPQQFQKNTHLGSKRNGVSQLQIDEEFLWVIGLYLAEGSNNKRSIQFALHRDEVEYQNRVISFFKNNGFNPKLRNTADNGAVVSVHSTSLAKWFPKWLGHLCCNKQIPNELMHLPDNKSLALIQGIFDGDASKRDADLVQTSEILALQVAEILHRLGKQPNLRIKMNKTLTTKGNKRRVAYGVSKELPTFTHKNRRGRWQFDEHLLTKIKRVDQVSYDGPVYNLEVDGDHTYVVQNIVVHNCYGTKFVFGYEQYYNPRSSDGRIMVRVGPTAENLKMQEAGLESSYPLDMWTLTVPTIKTRDVIVLFDQANNESFRYEVGDVIRNTTILGLDGDQHLRTFRVRKTDPIYQIRIFPDTKDFPSTLNTGLGFAPGLPPHSHTIVVNENVSNPTQINQTTGISQGHNHPIVNGTILSVLGHTHQIVIPNE